MKKPKRREPTVEELIEVAKKNNLPYVVSGTNIELDDEPHAAPPKPKRRSKYGNRKTVVDGLTFDSEKEAKRWIVLKALERSGKIKNLIRQVPYGLSVDGEFICRYVADFRYELDGKAVVEDTKGFRTAIYKIKRKLMKAIYGIVIKET